MTALGRYSLLAPIAALLLAGCGSGATGALLTGNAEQATARGHSWMSPGTSSEDLLYVLKQNSDIVYAYSYPHLNLVGQLTGFTDSPTGLCVDKQGDVFVTEENNVSTEGPTSLIVEYAHGRTEPFASLKDREFPSTCSVDPTTGNLAVTNWVKGQVAIYPNAQGSPTYISTPVALSLSPACAYDTQGNLFVSGKVGSSEYGLAELPSGGSSFTLVSLNESIGLAVLQWNRGKIVASPSTGGNTRYLYRIQISGTTGKIVGTTILDFRHDIGYLNGSSQFLIVGHRVLAAGPKDVVLRWGYPAGGHPKTVISQLAPSGIALSVAPSKKS